MARKKVNMAYIRNDPSRKATGRKRAAGAIKKAGELSVLCGVEACLVVALEDGTVQAWPSVPEAARVVDRYRSMPEVGRCKKKMDGDDYVRERVGKAREQLLKADHENRRRETMLLLHDAMVGRRENLAGLAVEQLVGIGWTTESLIKKIEDCIAYRRGGQKAIVKVDDPLPYDICHRPCRRGGSAPAAGMGHGGGQRLKAGCDLDALTYIGSRSGSGSYAGVGAGSDVMQLCNMDEGFAWDDRDT